MLKHMSYSVGTTSRGNQKKAFLPHEGFPHNNLAIPPCLVFWRVSIPGARSIQGTANRAGVIISRSVMKLLRQKDELKGNFATWIFIDWVWPFLFSLWCMGLIRKSLNSVALVHRGYKWDVITSTVTSPKHGKPNKLRPCSFLKQTICFSPKMSSLVPFPSSGPFCRTFT